MAGGTIRIAGMDLSTIKWHGFLSELTAAAERDLDIELDLSQTTRWDHRALRMLTQFHETVRRRCLSCRLVKPPASLLNALTQERLDEAFEVVE